MSPKTKRNISRILPFGFIWLIFSFIYTQLEKGLLGDSAYYPATGNPYNFYSNLLITPKMAMVAGLLIGALEILYLNKAFSNKNFTKKIFYKTLIYLVVIFFFLVILTVLVNSLELDVSIFNKQVWSHVLVFIRIYAFFSVGLYIAITILVSQFYSEVSEKIGHGVLNNFFTGKYHTPKQEERIFMFLDMSSSTTIAEEFGHVKYFEMLKSYYADLSDAIVNHYGEIYQYVGDEIVVSWDPKRGLRDNNCIQCFFAMKRAIKKRKNKYINKFGLVPGFRAGFHIGKVTTGEIGVVKKEIIFTGDVLNTTSRIQGLCKTFNVDILISADLVKKLKPISHFQMKSLGESELRGREEKIELFTLQPFTDKQLV
jgi:class 3 adenylate cyclase